MNSAIPNSEVAIGRRLNGSETLIDACSRLRSQVFKPRMLQAMKFAVMAATSLRCPTARFLARVRFDPFDRLRLGCAHPSCRGARLDRPCLERPCLERL